MIKRFLQGIVIGFLLYALAHYLEHDRLVYLILLMASPFIGLALFWKDLQS